MNNGPEDLLLEELVRNLKWKASHFRQRQQPQLADIRLLDDYDDQDDKALFQPEMDHLSHEQKNFAYRPNDDRFRNRPPIKINPLIQPAGTINFFVHVPSCLDTKEAIFQNTKGGRV